MNKIKFEIPISFYHGRKLYEDSLMKVFGIKENTWHIMINKKLFGQLQWTPSKGWEYIGKKFDDITNCFVEQIKAHRLK